MAKNLKPQAPIVQFFLLFSSAAALVFLALHHGTYGLAERQSAALVLWLCIAVLGGIGFLPRGRLEARDWLPAIVLLALVGWTAAGLTWTESRELTFNEIGRGSLYLALVSLLVLAVRRSNWRIFAAALPLAAVVVCFLALASRLFLGTFPRDDIALHLHTWRLSYPLGYWNAVGCWAAISFTLCLAWSAHARSSLVRALALAAAPVALVVVYMTVSRAAIGGVAIGTIAVVALGRYRVLTALQAAFAVVAGMLAIVVLRRHIGLVHGTSDAGAWAVLLALAAGGGVCAGFAVFARQFALDRDLVMSRRHAGVALAVGLAATVALAAFAVATFGDDAKREFNTTQISSANRGETRLLQLNGNRVNLWKSARRAFLTQPLHGVGAGTFGYWWNRYGSNGESVRDAHSIYVEALAEQGLLGFVLLVGFFAALLLLALLARGRLETAGDIGAHAGLTAAFLVFAFQAAFDWMWESTAVAVLALAAIVIAGGSSRAARTARAAVKWRVALVVGALAGALIQLPAIASGQRVAKSRADFRRRDYAAAIRDANDALTAEPWSASAYGQRALAKEAAGLLDSAAADLGAARSREPTNWVWPLLAARVATARGDAASARRELSEAQRLRPHASLFESRSNVP